MSYKIKKTRSYMIKANAYVQVLAYDESKPSGKQNVYTKEVLHSTKIFGFDRSYLISKKKCSCGHCGTEVYIFRHMNLGMIQVNSGDVIETALTIDKWIKENKHLSNEIAKRFTTCNSDNHRAA